MLPISEVETKLLESGQLVSAYGSAGGRIMRPSSILSVSPHTISFMNAAESEILARLKNLPDVVLLLPQLDEKTRALARTAAGRWLECRDPRLAFALVLQAFFEPKQSAEIHQTAQIDNTARLDSDVRVDAFTVIGQDVSIGADCWIGAHVDMYRGIKLGREIRVGAGCRLGGSGFGYQRDGSGILQRFPQIGSLLVGNNCEIGENVTINRGTMDDTILEDHVKMDDQCYVAHNVRIGHAALIMAGCRIMGGANIGDCVEINPGAMIGRGVIIGEGAVIGMGAVVLDNVAPYMFAAGVPATTKGPVSGT